MKLTKEIYLNDKKINTIEYTEESSTIEFINLLIHKTKKLYQITIRYDHIYNEVTATETQTTENHDNTINKYKIKYYFTDITSKIDL